MTTEAPASTLDGAVDRVTFYNPETGFSVVRVRLRGRREPVAVVGALPAVQPGERLVLTGRWHTDPRHGAQFRPDSAVVQPPSGLEDLRRYLGSGLIRQIGPVLAERIVGTFGERTLDVLDSAPERVREVPGIGQQRATTIAAAWQAHRALRAVAAFLAEHKLDTRFAARLVAAYGNDAPKVLATNPYRLVSDVPGLGFAAADGLGKSMGVRPTAAPRLQAATHAALLRVSEQGHTRLGTDALVAAAATLATVDADVVYPAVAQLLAGGVIAGAARPQSSQVDASQAAPVLSGRLRIYEPPPRPAPDPGVVDLGLGLGSLVRAEEFLAARLRILAAQAPAVAPARVDAWLADDGDARGLSPQQRDAVRAAALSGCFALTGGPGVGKTTTVRALVRCLLALGRSVALAAPTGKAAKRLGDVVGLQARTVHRLLGARPKGFNHGAMHPLPFDVTIVDEASMLDTGLARAVVSAIAPGAQLVLVGDADQLPSVGPGQVLRDILASDAVPSARLDTVFRQAALSQIVVNAHLIRQGQLPQLADAAALGRGVDCVFVRAGPDRLPDVAADWAASLLPKALGVPPADVQALAPLTRVCQVVNELLQRRLNPPRPDHPERPHGALPLRLDDRVIQTRNNYTLEVFNGDTGTVVEIASDGVTVDFGDGRVVAYAPADMLDLDHAYCLTVHRSQGSEWPGVVLLASSSFGPMLSRNLLYTALTRARRAAVLVGDEAAIARAVAETRDQQRRTGLGALLRAGDAADGPR